MAQITRRTPFKDRGMNKKHMKEIIHIIVIIILSLLLGALFLRIETMNQELKKEIPNQVHALVENTIRDTMRAEFIRQEELGNVFHNEPTYAIR